MSSNWISCTRCGRHLSGSSDYHYELCSGCRSEGHQGDHWGWCLDALLDFATFAILLFVLVAVLVVV